MRSSTAITLALVALAAFSAGAQAQSIGSAIGNMVDRMVDGVDARTFFTPGRCQNRPPQTPRNLEARPINPTTARLTWRARDNSCVDFYEVTVSNR
jgi:hypothetical protein